MKYCNTIEIDKMLSILYSDGIFIIPNYIKDVKPLYDETMELCEKEGGNYQFGRNYRGGKLNSFKGNSQIKKVFNSDWMKTLTKKHNKTSNNYGVNVFATHDYKLGKELARNGFLHFDQLWRLKFLIYLTDTNKDNGAFFCCKGSAKTGEKLRKTDKNSFPNIKNRIALDHKHLMDRFELKPVEEKAGSLIVFDTDTFHKGGIVNSGERLVLRLHCK